MTVTEQEPDPAALMAEYIKNRGDIFEEWHFMAKYIPLTIAKLHDTAGYILQNENKGTPDQELSASFRELIALCQLSTKDLRFAANHVRRLYRFGVTNAVIFEAAESYALVVGHASIALVAQAILLANDPAYPFGKMPEGGEPKELTPFPEMQMGWTATGEVPTSLAQEPEWQYAAAIDPEFVKRTASFIDHCMTDRRPGRVLSPGARELIAVAALCARSQVDLAATHIRRAYAYGFSKRKVLEAISCVQNMTGAVSVQLGIRAMQLADREGPLPAKG
jgi:alkylhydroperoxidase/carboxymuconolactone decarboxylase family protein YurZ